MISKSLDGRMARQQLTETGIRNECGGANGIGLLLDVTRKCPTNRLFWGETAWWMTQQQMGDLLHESGTQPARTLGVVKKNEDGALIGETNCRTRPQVGVTQKLTKVCRKLIQL